MKRRSQHKKRKPVHFQFVKPESEVGQRMYTLLRELVSLHHEDLLGARIALAWQLAWKPDVDGRVILGQCQRVSDLHREVWGDVASYDFIILLRQVFWDDPLVTDHQRRALLDHELCHGTTKLDANGETVIDDHGRTVYRMVKHTIEDFTEIVDRYGCYKNDLVVFAQALDRARARADGQWVGYQSLQEDLRLAGVSLPLEVLREWSADERREARTWAVLRQQFPSAAIGAQPGCLARARGYDMPTAVSVGNEGALEASLLGTAAAPAAEGTASDPSASDATREP